MRPLQGSEQSRGSTSSYVLYSTGVCFSPNVVSLNALRGKSIVNLEMHLSGHGLEAFDEWSVVKLYSCQ